MAKKRGKHIQARDIILCLRRMRKLLKALEKPIAQLGGAAVPGRIEGQIWYDSCEIDVTPLLGSTGAPRTKKARRRAKTKA
jgi:hypothetical protein